MNRKRLEDVVKTSLGTFAPFPAKQIDTLTNSEKYSINENRDIENNTELERIFDYMGQLNETAVNNETLCSGNKKLSIRDCLIYAAEFVAKYSDGKPIRYIEIGPEPHKTSLLLQKLEKNNASITSYIGLDINPKSKFRMHHTLKSIIGSARFHYIIADYNECNADDLGTHHGLTIVTMLGFQEGNELPEKMINILTRLTKPGDILLSEMQLYSVSGYGPIVNFYNLKPMKLFSNIVCKRNGISTNEAHSIFITPIDTALGKTMVASTIVPYRHNYSQRYLVTNCCIKYTRQQFREIREQQGVFHVVEEFLTGDGTIAYQFALRD